MRTQLIDLDGRSYTARRMDPLTGGHIYMRMMQAVSNMVMEAQAKGFDRHGEADVKHQATDEERTRLLVGLGMANLSFADSTFVNRSALAVVVETETKIPIMSDDGRWADPNLEDDPAAVQHLAVESLVFSLMPFFAKSGRSKANGEPAQATNR